MVSVASLNKMQHLCALQVISPDHWGAPTRSSWTPAATSPIPRRPTLRPVALAPDESMSPRYSFVQVGKNLGKWEKLPCFFHSFWKAWQVLGENLEGKILCFCEVLTVQIPCLDLLQQTLLNWWRRHGHWNGHITWTEKFNASAWWRMENTLAVTEKVVLHTKVLPSVRRKRWVLCGCEVALLS